MALISDRFFDAGTYWDPVSGILVRLTWDATDECWRLWERVAGAWTRVPGKSLGADTSDDGVAKAVAITLDTYEALVDADARRRADGVK